jgi:hypothetical protein
LFVRKIRSFGDEYVRSGVIPVSQKMGHREVLKSRNRDEPANESHLCASFSIFWLKKFHSDSNICIGGTIMKKQPVSTVKDGDRCVVTGGTHAGKSGTVRDINTSATGQITITVVQKNGERFKTLAKNVTVT